MDPCSGFAEALNNPVWNCIKVPMFVLLAVILTGGMIMVGWKFFFGKEAVVNLGEADKTVARTFTLIFSAVIGVMVLIQPFTGFFAVTWFMKIISWISVTSGGPALCG